MRMQSIDVAVPLELQAAPSEILEVRRGAKSLRIAGVAVAVPRQKQCSFQAEAWRTRDQVSAVKAVLFMLSAKEIPAR